MLLDKYRVRFEKPLVWRVSSFILDSLGFPFIFFNRKKPETIKKILVIRKDEIGDLVLSTPIYEAIKKKYPQSELTVLCSKIASQVLKNNPYVDRIIESNNFYKDKKLDFFLAVKELKGEKFDIGIDPKGSIVNIALMFFSKIKRRISYYNVSGGRFLLTDPIFYSKQISEIEANLNILKPLGIDEKLIMPKIYLNNKEKKDVKDLVRKEKLGKFVLVYSVPSKKCKEWSFENFNKLVSLFPKTKFVFIGTSKDSEKINEATKGNKNCIKLIDFDLRKLSYIAGLAKAVLAVDGGPLHLSWISNKNTISLFGQNDLILWKPLNGEIISHLPENEQGLNRKKVNLDSENEYMKMITVQEVSEKLGKRLR